MERHSKRNAKKLARELAESRRRVREYQEANVVNSSEYKLKGSLGIRYRHPGEETWTDLGIVSENIVTNAAIAILVSVLQGGSATTLQNFKWHASGTSSTAESASDTTLGTEIGEVRDEGTQTTAGAGTYQSVATHTYSSTYAVTEHGIFTAASGGTLLDRSVFTAINVVVATQIQFTYTLTITGA